MLILTRKVDESLVIGDGIEVVVTAIEGNTVKLGIKADKDIRIYRKEVVEEVRKINASSIAEYNVFEGLKKK